MFNYSALKVGDMVCTGGHDGLAALVRFATMRKRIPYDKDKVSTHTGIVVQWGDQFFIAEMTADGITLSPFLKYTDGNRFILDIRRNTSLEVYGARDAINCRVAKDYRRSIEYDFTGAVGFVFSRIKQNPKRFYCSEYFVWLYSDLGVPFPSELLHRVSPQQLYELPGWYSVPGWKGKEV